MRLVGQGIWVTPTFLIQNGSFLERRVGFNTGAVFGECRFF
jgi:hypothetical protein